MPATRKMKARKQSACPGCGGLINIGNTIHKFPADERWFICEPCALARHGGIGEPFSGMKPLSVSPLLGRKTPRLRARQGH